VIPVHGPVGAQETGAVVGLVRDSNGQPVPDVLVFTLDGAAATLTDELGLWGLFALPLERQVLGYRKAGYAPRSYDLDLSTGDDYRDLGAVVLEPGAEPTATFVGSVTDGQGGPGLAGATVELNGRVVTETDSLGAFTLSSSPVAWGTNELTVRHRAFSDRSVSDRIWVSNVSETFDFVVAMGVEPVALPGIDVGVQSRVLAANGFYDRSERIRSGVFLTRDEIARRNPVRMEDLLRGALGAGLSRSMRQTGTSPDPQTGAPVAASSFGRAEDGRPCLTIFYLNGLRMGEVDAPTGIGSGIDQLVHPDEVEGIEIYESVAQLPARFSPVGSVCGVILIWTASG
jgi:hypothetical protein